MYSFKDNTNMQHETGSSPTLDQIEISEQSESEIKEIDDLNERVAVVIETGSTFKESDIAVDETTSEAPVIEHIAIEEETVSTTVIERSDELHEVEMTTTETTVSTMVNEKDIGEPEVEMTTTENVVASTIMDITTNNSDDPNNITATNVSDNVQDLVQPVIPEEEQVEEIPIVTASNSTRLDPYAGYTTPKSKRRAKKKRKIAFDQAPEPPVMYNGVIVSYTKDTMPPDMIK